MKLIQLQVFPKGAAGLASELLVFGEHVTQLYGENGCGKSPIIQSILYCLGYPCDFRDIIYERCEFVRLIINIDNTEYVISRRYDKKKVDIRIEHNGATQVFLNESEYSEYIFQLLNLRYDNLVSNSRKCIKPYLSTILPIFYLNQESGYSQVYDPESSFIQNQPSEMIRLLFDFPIKNAFDNKKQKFQAKDNLDNLENKLLDYQKKIDTEKSNLTVQDGITEEIRHSINSLEKEVEILRKSGASHDDSIKALDQLIIFNSRKVQETQNTINLIERRRQGIGQIINEIDIEIQTLNLNESARRVFHSFDNLCGTENCQMFSESVQEYSKNLLYLRDQIKDLKRNDELSLSRIEDLRNQKNTIILESNKVEKKKKEIVSKSEFSAVIESIAETKNKIFDLQIQLFEVERLEKLKEKQFEYVAARDKAREKYDSFSLSNKPVLSIIRFKSQLKVLYVKWLEILHTPNIDKNIVFDDNFKPIFGNEKIGQLKGSTLTRTVLAYHSALFELMCLNKTLSFCFLVFDTPRQHELDNSHLDSYFKRLKELCINYNVQIIFSSSTYRYEGDDSDIDWIPKYVNEEGGSLKFLEAK